MSGQAIWRRILAGAFTILGLAGALNSQEKKPRMLRVGLEMLCVTEGTIGEAADHRLSVNVPKMRAYVNRHTTRPFHVGLGHDVVIPVMSQTIEARFIYLGPSGNEARLGSGEMRRQFGLKLRAQDPCNLVYAMWRIEPESRLVVSVKENQGQHTSAECGNRGYRNVKPLRSVAVPMLRPGNTHSLRAEMNGEQLRVFADEAVVWEGTLGTDIRNLDGPVGIRSDNARLELELQAVELPAGQGSVMPCKTGYSEE